MPIYKIYNIGNWYGIKFPQIIATLLQNYLLIFLFHHNFISIFAQIWQLRGIKVGALRCQYWKLLGNFGG